MVNATGTTAKLARGRDDWRVPAPSRKREAPATRRAPSPMIDPKAIFELTGVTVVFEDGFGYQEARRVAVTDWYGPEEKYAHTDEDEPHYKASGANGDVFIPESAVDDITEIA